MFISKVGENRGKPRVWLERGVLRAAGNTLVLTVNPTGARRVAGTPERPIVDINGARILEGLGAPGTPLEVTNPAPGVLLITPAA